jgi:hypothetical protein
VRNTGSGPAAESSRALKKAGDTALDIVVEFSQAGGAILVAVNHPTAANGNQITLPAIAAQSATL